MSQANAKNKIVEEYDENEATGVEAEEPGNGAHAPYDPAKIRVDPKTFSPRVPVHAPQPRRLTLLREFTLASPRGRPHPLAPTAFCRVPLSQRHCFYKDSVGEGVGGEVCVSSAGDLSQ